MARLLFALIASVTLPAALAAAAPAADFAAFDRSVAATKQAMMADPEHALASALRAVELAKQLPPSARSDAAIGTAEWLHGEALIGVNRLAEAQPIVDRNLALVQRTQPNSKLYGDLLRSHGALAGAQGHVLQALHDYQQAFRVFRAAGVPRSEAIALQDIGAIYWDGGDYQRTLDYYQQSTEVFSGDPTLTLTMHSNRAQVFYKEKRYTEAAAEFRAALEQARALGSSLLQVRILTYLGRSEVEAGRNASAQAAIDQATHLARNGEAAGWQPFVYGVAARIAFDRGDLAQAQALIARTFAGVDIGHTDLEYRDQHEIAARIYEAAGDQRQALAQLKAFGRLDSEAQALTASAASQLMAANFDFANQKLKISQLKQGQLQRDVQLGQQRGRLQSLALAAVAIIAGLLAVGFVSLRRSRNATRDANTVLSEVNGRLESALKAKTEFLATTSHEIRTPLNGILGMTQVLLADGKVGGDVRDRIEVVHGAGETMKALVDDILDVAKMESGRLTVSEGPTDLRRILVDVGRLWTGHAARKQLALVVDVDAAPDQLVTDGARVRQIVFNLMSNALKFTAAGEVALRAHVGDDATVLVTVTDTGIGIAADQQETIFEPFRQVDGGVTRQFGGTGLGLAICRNLARALGGDVTVASGPGGGSCFTLTLPLKQVEGATGEDSPLDQAERLAGTSILVVDADAATAGLLRLTLAAEGAATSVAAGPADAVAQIAAGSVSHVLCDVVSAGDDPLPGLHALIDAGEAAGIPITLLTPANGPVPVAGLMMLGAAQVVVRPIDGDDLVAALASLGTDAPEAFVAPALLARAA